METTKTKISAGFYQVSNGTNFGNLHKQPDGWYADFRRCSDGVLLQLAGIWPTMREAREEVEWLMATPDERLAWLEAYKEETRRLYS